MAKNITAKIAFLNDQIEGLRARMVGQDNGAQRAKLALLTDIRGDYQAAVDREIAQRRENAA